MNIYTVRDNLINTIEGKEGMLVTLNETLKDIELDSVQRTVIATTAKFLEVNLDELRKILKDVTICCNQATEQRWLENPDRSGGQFTQDEINQY